MEPYEEYDEYIARIEEAYKRLIEGKTCINCINCEVYPKNESIGFCKLYGEFVDDEDTIKELGFDCFEV